MTTTVQIVAGKALLLSKAWQHVMARNTCMDAYTTKTELSQSMVNACFASALCRFTGGSYATFKLIPKFWSWMTRRKQTNTATRFLLELVSIRYGGTILCLDRGRQITRMMHSTG